jgi:hypothetical protein
VVLAIASLTVLLASCSSTPSTSHSTTTSTTSRHSTTTTTQAGATTTTQAGATTTTQTGPANCTPAQLAVTAGMAQGAAGTIGQVILFQNTSTSTCVLHGFPGVAGLDNVGNQIAQASRVVNQVPFTGSTASLPTVQLAPGDTASALVLSTDVPMGTATSCLTYGGLLVTPPNTFQSVRLNAMLPGCSGLRTGPVYSGTTGQG